MKLMRSFRVMAFALTLLSITSFCAATGQVTFLLVAGAIAAFSWYITEGPKGWAIPKWAGNILIIIASVAMVPDLVNHRNEVIAVLGRFAVWLTLIKLYERKIYRDYAQLLWLTLVLMVAGALESRALVFGLAVIIYSALGIYVLLLFQLYSAHQAALGERRHRLLTTSVFIPPLRPVLGRAVGGQFFSTSAVIGCLGLLIGAMVFIGYPRGIGHGAIHQFMQPSTDSTTGFVNQVNLMTSTGTRITESKSPVLEVSVRNPQGNLVEYPAGLYLRGAALDRYDPSGHVWRASPVPVDRRTTGNTSPQTPVRLGEFETNSDVQTALKNAFEIEIVPLEPMGSVAFSIRLPITLATDLQQQYRYDQVTQTLTLPNNQDMGAYRVQSNPLPDRETERSLVRRYASLRQTRYNNPRVRAFAESLLRAKGLSLKSPQTWPERGRHAQQVARVISDHFQTGFTYTLDLSGVRIDGDPIEQFLFEFKMGHCEYYASAMTALCQSVGIDARVVTGFLASEYQGDGKYLVRAANAHAWVEVRTRDFGWDTYDPTPAADIEALLASDDSLAERVRGIYEMFEVGWMRNVMNFDSTAQGDLASGINLDSFAWLDDAFSGFTTWIEGFTDRFGFAGTLQIGVVTSAFVVALLIVIRLVRRARRIKAMLQLGHLHRAEYRRMLSQLGFYLDMLDVLRRGGFSKPAWQPPIAFALDINTQRPDVGSFVRQVSSLFYKARFGGRELSSEESNEASRAVQELALRLAVRRP